MAFDWFTVCMNMACVYINNSISNENQKLYGGFLEQSHNDIVV